MPCALDDDDVFATPRTRAVPAGERATGATARPGGPSLTAAEQSTDERTDVPCGFPV